MAVTEEIIAEMLHAATAVVKAFLIQFFGSPDLQSWAKLQGNKDLQSTLDYFQELREADYYGDTEVIAYFHEITTAIANSLDRSQIHVLSQIAHHFGCQNGRPSRKFIRLAADLLNKLNPLLRRIYSSTVSSQERTTFEHFQKMAHEPFLWLDYRTNEKKGMLYEWRSSCFKKCAPQQIIPDRCMFGVI